MTHRAPASVSRCPSCGSTVGVASGVAGTTVVSTAAASPPPAADDRARSPQPASVAVASAASGVRLVDRRLRLRRRLPSRLPRPRRPRPRRPRPPSRPVPSARAARVRRAARHGGLVGVRFGARVRSSWRRRRCGRVDETDAAGPGRDPPGELVLDTGLSTTWAAYAWRVRPPPMIHDPRWTGGSTLTYSALNASGLGLRVGADLQEVERRLVIRDERGDELTRDRRFGDSAPGPRASAFMSARTRRHEETEQRSDGHRGGGLVRRLNQMRRRRIDPPSVSMSLPRSVRPKSTGWRKRRGPLSPQDSSSG